MGSRQTEYAEMGSDIEEKHRVAAVRQKHLKLGTLFRILHLISLEDFIGPGMANELARGGEP